MTSTTMRLFLLPISTRRTLIYCERAVPTQLPSGQRPPLSDRIITKAATTWATWEKAEKGWQRSITHYGNNLFKRIAFEEWGLKSLPPATKKRIEDVNHGRLKFECLYPGAVLKNEQRTVQVLQKLAVERQGLHNRNLWSCIAWMPVSFPFTFVPILPNLPFYYLCFRAWSHYRALYGSRLLAHLVGAKPTSGQTSLASTTSPSVPAPQLPHLALSASSILDTLYTSAHKQLLQTPQSSASAIDLSSSSSADLTTLPETMLLHRDTGALLAREFGVPELQMEVERAVEQVEAKLKKAEAKVKEKEERKGNAEEKR